ncbi:MAG: sigma-54-dependent transcriptional regulator [Polyangiales bacterium]
MTSPAKIRVLVVDDEEGIRKTLRICLESAGYQVTLATNGEAAVAIAKKTPPDLVLVDLRLGGMDGIAVTKALAQETPSTVVILMTAYATIDNAVEAIRSGASDYLPKPFTPAQVLHAVSRALEGARVRQELAELKRITGRGIHPRFDSKSPAVRSVLDVAGRVAASDATVLILGETGTGKGVLARRLHELSSRAQRPFVTVNCAVIAPTLIENELFGHARGAFTGAEGARAGHVEAAGSGTLFLDEVGDLPREAQGKLLRLLEEHEYVRVGDVEPRRSEARVIAATHRNLKDAAAAGTFREDLFYRLNVVSLRMPALRERREDIVDLVTSMVPDLCEQQRRRPMTVTAAAQDALSRYPWPGNLRELVNVVERAVILAVGDEIGLDLLPDEVRSQSRAAPVDLANDEADESLDGLERRHIARMLAKYPKLEAASKALGIDPSTLYRKRERYGLR